MEVLDADDSFASRGRQRASDPQVRIAAQENSGVSETGRYNVKRSET